MYGGKGLEAIRSRIFMSGYSQAVRIPAEFRLSTDSVSINRTADGDLLIHPCPAQRGHATLRQLDQLVRPLQVLYPEARRSVDMTASSQHAATPRQTDRC
jgi:virulence-associated protein VagC